MEKHFFKRLITIIIAFAVVFLLGFLFIVIVPGNAALGIVYLMIYIISFMIVLTVLGLILDSIILYRKKERDKAEASLFVLAIFLFVIFLIFTIFFKKFKFILHKAPVSAIPYNNTCYNPYIHLKVCLLPTMCQYTDILIFKPVLQVFWHFTISKRIATLSIIESVH